jgi:hypothetical protein
MIKHIQFTQVDAVGSLVSSAPASRMLNFGTSCEKPSKGGLGHDVTKRMLRHMCV